MKLIITLFVLGVCMPGILPAQSLAGKKILTTGFGLGFTQQEQDNESAIPPEYHTRSFNISADVLYGRVNKRNLLFAYGIGVTHQVTRSKTGNEPASKWKDTRIYPTVMLQKYLPLNPRLFFSPEAHVRVRYKSEYNTRLYEAESFLRPFAITFTVKQKTLLQLQFGQVHVRQSNTVSRGDGSKSRSSTSLIDFNMNYVNAGVQFLL
ncbi:MAG: hypothetical protein EOO09_08510 [Chitinophagaceae bacterium]|nr:MAG: hypothetical protein EOO09_08510 [Chitinophagaceae bacterium]